MFYIWCIINGVTHLEQNKMNNSEVSKMWNRLDNDEKLEAIKKKQLDNT